MIFAELPLTDCAGAILAHSQRVGADMFRKGRVLTEADIAALRMAGLVHVTVAKLDADDVAENAAAQQLAEALAGTDPHLTLDPAFAGRVNIHAASAGVLALDVGAIDALNALDEAVTLATLPPFAAMVPGQMAATIKIIPYAVPRALLDQALTRIRAASRPLLRLHPYRSQRIALIQTELPGLKPSVLEKTERVTGDRLAAMGQSAPIATRCAHNSDALAAAIADARRTEAKMILIIGASAISDRRDVIPAAITRQGGTVDHFGMPVDPGNLLLLAHIGTIPVLGLPGCARSIKLNGCDWVLQRLLAGLEVGPADIRALGVGGLLAEIPSRPLPREARPLAAAAPKTAAIVLAAGRSSRMGRNKLLLDLGGKPIVAHVLDTVAKAGFAEIVVVTGHQAGKVKAALAHHAGVKIVEARDYAAGMAASLKTGLKALSPEIDAAMVILGDMPQVSRDLLHRLIAAYQPLEGRAIVLPVADGKRGNPVLFDRRFFADMAKVDGDVGARHIIGGNSELVAEIPAEAAEIFVDVDTPEAYRQLLAGNPT
ncbi:MAG: molybdopterin-binding/glycosyltransferase family 2 protein [Rhodospirillaceae bacterium]|nr:molybdopterin-binding/glycosyltransferase family 2 protein [Rhodospirillaceae bacterium]